MVHGPGCSVSLTSHIGTDFAQKTQSPFACLASKIVYGLTPVPGQHRYAPNCYVIREKSMAYIPQG